MLKNPHFPARAGCGEGRGTALASERMFSASQALLRKHCQGPGNLRSQSLGGHSETLSIISTCPEEGWEAAQRGGDLPVTEGAQDGTAVLTPEVAKQHPVDQMQCPDVFCLASLVCHDKSEAMFKTERCKTKIWLSSFS